MHKVNATRQRTNCNLSTSKAFTLTVPTVPRMHMQPAYESSVVQCKYMTSKLHKMLAERPCLERSSTATVPALERQPVTTVCFCICALTMTRFLLYGTHLGVAPNLLWPPIHRTASAPGQAGSLPAAGCRLIRARNKAGCCAGRRTRAACRRPAHRWLRRWCAAGGAAQLG